MRAFARSEGAAQTALFLGTVVGGGVLGGVAYVLFSAIGFGNMVGVVLAATFGLTIGLAAYVGFKATLRLSLNRFAARARSAGLDVPPMPNPWSSNELVLTDRLVDATISRLLALQEERHRALRESAQTDGLTGVLNRAGLDDHFSIAVQRGRAERFALGVLMLDLDHFKDVNDRFGHLVGDAVLRRVARVIRQSVRATDPVARYGGEEFVVLLQGSSPDDLASVGEKVRAAVAVSHLETDQPPITVSIGAAWCGVESFADTPTEAVTEQLLKQADDALYRAKRAGRNRLVRAWAPVDTDGPTEGAGDALPVSKIAQQPSPSAPLL